MSAKYQITWDDEYSIGISIIDGQHSKLIEKIRYLLNAIIQGKGEAEIGTILKFLSSYISGHFATEEKFMLESGYQGYKIHKRQHEEFKKKFNEEIKNEYISFGPSKKLAIKIEKELWAWYKTHIINTDMLFGKFLIEKKLPPRENTINSLIKNLGIHYDNLIMLTADNDRKNSIKQMRTYLDKIENEINENPDF